MFLPKLLLNRSRVGFRLVVEIKIYSISKAFVYSNIQINSKWLVKVKKNRKKKKNRKINTKNSKELSCCLKALALKSSKKITTLPAKKKIKVELARELSTALLRRPSKPNAGCWLIKSKVKIIKSSKSLWKRPLPEICNLGSLELPALSLKKKYTTKLKYRSSWIKKKLIK